MARSSSGVNKSEKIRAYYRAHRRVKPSQVVAALAAEGISVTAAQVSSVRQIMKKKKGKIRPRAAKATVAARRRKKSMISGLDQLLKAKELVDAAGGFDQARQCLDVLEQLA